MKWSEVVRIEKLSERMKGGSVFLAAVRATSLVLVALTAMWFGLTGGWYEGDAYVPWHWNSGTALLWSSGGLAVVSILASIVEWNRAWFLPFAFSLASFSSLLFAPVTIACY